jgi:hypothetical protein
MAGFDGDSGAHPDGGARGEQSFLERKKVVAFLYPAVNT